MENNLIKRESQQEVQTYQEPMTWIEVQMQVNLVQEVMQHVMIKDEHYGVIPGCGAKPALLKAGAEKLAMTFRLAPKFEIQEREMPNNHREYSITASIYGTSGNFLGSGVGSACTMEGKWRFRTGEVELTGKPVPSDYWTDRDINLIGGKGFVTKKVDGKWFIAKQGVKVEHDNPADYYNTCLKMAKKRALVDAILTVTAASDIFTQDIDDSPELFGGGTNVSTQSKSSPVDPKTGLYVQPEPLGNIIDAEMETMPEMPDYLKEPIPEPEDEGKRARETAAEVFEGEVVEPQKTTPILDEDEATRIKLHALLQSRNGGTEPYPNLCAAAKEVLKQCTAFKDLKLIDRLDWLKGGRLNAAYGNAKKKYPALKEDELFPMPK